jgi:hypothetical protein
MTAFTPDERVESWAKRLGLAQTRLRSARKDPSGHHYAMLDGVDGSLAISTSPVDTQQGLDWTWSSQLRAHVEVGEEKVVVRPVEQRAQVLRFDLPQVDANVEKFFDVVTAQKTSPAITVVEHVANCFRAHRAVEEREAPNPHGSLRSFLSILDSLIDDKSQQMTDVNAEHRLRVIEELSYNRLVGRQADLELTVRHAAGMMFQEAHAELDAEPLAPQLFGLAPAPRRSTRNRLGAYYTPPGLARTLCDLAIQPHLSQPKITIFDPACGSGIFLLEALRSLERYGYVGQVVLIGFDISSVAIEMATFSLKHADTELNVRFSVTARDFLRSDDAIAADIVLMNPPFVAYEDLTPELKADIKAKLGDAYRFKPDFSMLFVSLALAQLRQGGSLASLLPAGVLQQNSAKDWRSSIVEGNTLELVAILGDHGLFRDAMVNISAILLRDTADGTKLQPTMFWASQKRGASSEGLRHLRRWAEGDKRPQRVPDWSIYQARPGLITPKGNWTPRPNSLGNLPETLREKSLISTIGNLFHVEQGIRPGRIGERLIISLAIWESLPRKEQDYFRPVAENRSIRAGQIQPVHMMFYPEKPMAGAEVLEALPKFYSLRIAELNLAASEPVEAIRPRRATNSEFLPRLVSRIYVAEDSFAVDEEGIHVVVQGSSWIPQPPLTSNTDHLPSLLVDYALLMNSRLFFLLLREFCRIVGGGQVEASQASTLTIPLPNLPLLYREFPQIAAEADVLRNRNEISYPSMGELDRFAAAAYQTDVSEWTQPL